MAVDFFPLAGAVDLSSVVAAIIAIALVAMGVYVVSWGAMKILEFVSDGGVPDWDVPDFDAQDEAHRIHGESFEAGYRRDQFDSSWSEAQKAAWREGVAARHADSNGRGVL